jgi:hypothetical protein
MIRSVQRIVLLATALLVAAATPVAAQWTARTTMTFTERVKVPDLTLEPGSYIFELVDPSSSVPVVKITDKDGKKNFGVMHTVPTRRADATEDVVLLFSPTETGAMPAIRGWYPAGGKNGYLLVYGSDEARQLAERTREVVLSRNVSGTNQESGTIVVFNPTGQTTAWRQDPETQREWEAWRQSQRRDAASADRRDADRDKSVATMVADPAQGEKVKIDDLEKHPERYAGKTISVDGEVDKLLGPRAFELEEPDGKDDGEVLVLLTSGLVAMLRDEDKVTVSGTVKTFSKADLHREAIWLDLSDIPAEELVDKPILVATRIAGGEASRSYVVDLSGKVMAPTTAVITDFGILSRGDHTLVGRHVDLTKLSIESIDGKDGFFARAGDGRVFVLLDDPEELELRVGDTVAVNGVVLALPANIGARLKAPAGANSVIYIYAKDVKR